MAKITINKVEINLPRELRFMKKLSSKNWSKAATIALQKKLDEAAEFRRIISKSKATQKDVDELSDKINTAMWKHYKKYLKENR